MKIQFAWLYLDLIGFGASLLRDIHCDGLHFLLGPVPGRVISYEANDFFLIIDYKRNLIAIMINY